MIERFCQRNPFILALTYNVTPSAVHSHLMNVDLVLDLIQVWRFAFLCAAERFVLTAVLDSQR